MVAPVVNMTSYEKSFGPRSRTNTLTLHSAECPLQGGYAQSLTNWANTPLAAGGVVASWNTFVDPIARVQMLPKSHSAWHASEANVCSIGYEQAGYARFTRAEWLTDAGKAQLENLAFEMAQDAKAYGIPAVWLSDAQVRRAIEVGDVKGFSTHRQIDPETRTDPGNGYPYDLLINRVREILGDTSSPAVPAPSSSAALDPNDRIVGAYGANVRSAPVVASNNLVNELGSGYPSTMKGFVRGQHVNGSNIWFVSIDGFYLHVSGFDNQSLSGLTDYGTTGTAAPAPAAPPVAASGQTLTLPASASSWNVYPLGVAPVSGNQSGKLAPSRFGGLQYSIVRWAQTDVAVIRTQSFGEVQIYVAPGTGAVVSGSSAPAAPVASETLHSRTVTTEGANVRTEPRVGNNIAPGYAGGLAKGAPLLVKGYVKGQDASGNGDDAWFLTKSGYFVWANGAGNDISGLPKLN
jgi:hypothetical protein